MQQSAKKRNFVPIVIVLTLVINLLVALLFFAPPLQVGDGFDWTILPFLNAIFNSFTFMLLLGAWISIRRGNRINHRRFIGGAMTTTTLFLISYVTYHAVSESTKFGGEGFVRPVVLLYFDFAYYFSSGHRPTGPDVACPCVESKFRKT